MEIVDLSQEIFPGMPVFGDHPQVSIDVAVTHEQRQKLTDSQTISPVVHAVRLTEHTGTHVDAFNHFGIPWSDESIDTMPLDMFFTEGICLDLSGKGLLELIEPEDIEGAEAASSEKIRPKDTVLIYTDHYRKHWGTDDWVKGPGLSVDSVRWLADKEVYAFGVEPRSPGILGKGNVEIHTLSGERHFTHYENLINLHKLVGRGRFRFIALPLRIRGGTGSPVRAVAVFE